MVAPILSPQPRHAPNPRLLSSRPVMSPSIRPQDALRVASRKRVFTPPKLSTPVDLFDPRANKSQASKASTTCGPSSKRRRTIAFNAVRSPRRRPCLRTERPVSPLASPTFFDHLPWISQLEHSQHGMLPMDIADLSVPEDDYMHVEPPCSGPVRTRKTSLRSDPLAASPSRSPGGPPDLHDLPVYALLPTDRLPSTPRTPIREAFVPSEVRFHNLHPIVAHVDDG